jgi:DNA-binding transcriptional MerR regulator
VRIGEVAERAGVNVQTLRYYERRGLLDPPPRTPSGYRIYSTETIKLLSLRDDLAPTDARSIVSEKLAGVRARMSHLKTMDEALTQLLTGDTSSSPDHDLDELLFEALA